MISFKFPQRLFGFVKFFSILLHYLESDRRRMLLPASPPKKEKLESGI